MKLSIDMKGLDEVRKSIQGFSERRMNAAVATAMTQTAKTIAGQWQGEIDQRIDRPTARTRAATSFQGASAGRLEAQVFVKDRMPGTTPAEYLGVQETGGRRRIKKFEQALISAGAMPSGYVTVPGRGSKLDSYGNVSRKLIIAVIAQLGSDYSPGYARVIAKSTAKRLATAAKRGRAFIVVRPEDAKQAGTDPGIYERQADGRRKAVFLFKRAVTYRKRLDLLNGTAAQADAVLQVEVGRAVRDAVDGLARRGAA